MKDYRIDFASMEWDSPMPGVRRKGITRLGRTLRLVEYSVRMPAHWCRKGHVGYIVEGELEIEFPDGTRVFRPGEGLFIPDGEEHRHMARPLTDSVRVVLFEDA